MKEKIKIIWQVLRTWIGGWFRGRANRKISNPKRVLVVQMAKLGDMVCTTPMFRAIKKNYPECKVAVLGNAINKEVLDGNADVDEYLVAGKDFKREVDKIRRGDFEAVFLTSPNLFHLMAAYAARVPLIVATWVEGGFSPLMTRSYRWLASRLAVVVPHRMGQYAPREYLRLLEMIEIKETETKKYLNFSAAAREKAAEILKEATGLKVGVAVTAGNKIKEWPRNNFAELIDYLIERNVRVVLLGASQDREAVDEVLKYVRDRKGLTDLTGKLSIDELKAVVAKLDLFISVDTGPIYIAEAFGIPTIDIVGPVDEREQPPRGDKHFVVAPKRVKPELYVMNARVYNKEEARRQAEGVEVEKVKRAVKTLLLAYE